MLKSISYREGGGVICVCANTFGFCFFELARDLFIFLIDLIIKGQDNTESPGPLKYKI